MKDLRLFAKYSISSSSSNKGNIGWVNSDSLSKRIYNVIIKMNLGEVSEPIMNSDTILFLKIDDKRLIKKKIG